MTERLLGLGDEWEAFTVVIQLGAILAVVAIYFQVFWQALIGLPTSADARRFALGLIVALLPSVVAGLALKKLLDEVLLNPAFAMPFIAGCWIAGGIIILVFERIAPKPRFFEGDKLPLLKAFQIGCCQILSIIPGVSRSGATILGGEILGVDRKAATLFTFYLAVPTMTGRDHSGTAPEGRLLDPWPDTRHRHRLCRVLHCGVFRDPGILADRHQVWPEAFRLLPDCRRSRADRLFDDALNLTRSRCAPDRHTRPWRDSATDRTGSPLPPRSA